MADELDREEHDAGEVGGGWSTAGEFDRGEEHDAGEVGRAELVAELELDQEHATMRRRRSRRA